MLLLPVVLGPEAVLGFPRVSASLWLMKMPLWLPGPHGRLGTNADPILGHPPLTLCPGAGPSLLLGSVCIGGGGVEEGTRQEQSLPVRGHK